MTSSEISDELSYVARWSWTGYVHVLAKKHTALQCVCRAASYPAESLAWLTTEPQNLLSPPVIIVFLELDVIAFQLLKWPHGSERCHTTRKLHVQVTSLTLSTACCFTFHINGANMAKDKDCTCIKSLAVISEILQWQTFTFLSNNKQTEFFFFFFFFADS